MYYKSCYSENRYNGVFSGVRDIFKRYNILYVYLLFVNCGMFIIIDLNIILYSSLYVQYNRKKRCLKKSVYTKPFPLFGCKHQRPLYHFITSRLYLSAGCSTFLHRHYAEFIFYRPDHLALDLRVDLFLNVEFSYIYI